ncbi:MAG: hypothetical protein LBM09_00050 [Candidatus Nomurabacteria bacterium]|jgi:hypothetical protein|nr:hypothetical protein [Candidatus Nomurabacteria bacterium]
MDNSFLSQATTSQGGFGSDFNGVDASGNIIVPNETITTNDNSTVGSEQQLPPPPAPEPDFSFISPLSAPIVMPPKEESVNEPEQTSETEQVFGTTTPSVPITPLSEIDDAEKLDFIKTYTKEFDDTLQRSTEAAQKILDSIDVVIREHSSDIVIPDEANEFINQPPADGKVQKFDEARAIVNQIMARAEQAKQQSEQAAAEASQIYDDVQKFKNDTKEEIARLTAES